MTKNRKTQKILARPKKHQKIVARPALARPVQVENLSPVQFIARPFIRAGVYALKVTFYIDQKFGYILPFPSSPV